VSTKTIKHCWSHTKIVSLCDKAGMPISTPPVTNNLENPNEELDKELGEELGKELQQQIDALCIRTPMSIKNWLNPEDEQEVHQQFANEDFVQGAIEIEQREEEKILEPTLTAKEKLNVLRDAMKIVTDIVDDGGVILRSLRKIQSHIHDE
ncbi:36637_t:CDS:1, partial [Racocetra persica]